MKTFCDNLEPLQIELINRKGEKKVLTSRFLTPKALQKCDEIFRKRKPDESDIFEVICKQIAYLFGGKPEDYEDFSYQVLKGIMDHVKEEMLNPLDQVPNK